MQFEKGFLEVLSRRFGTRQINANHVYNEYIKDKDHIHMNATMWTTLSGFVKYLGRTGKCKVEESEKGWLIEFIDRSPEKHRREQEKQRQRRKEQLEEMKHQQEMTKKAEEAAKVTGEIGPAQPTELKREAEGSGSAEIKVKLGAPAPPPAKKARKEATTNGSVKDSKIKNIFGNEDEDDEELPSAAGAGAGAGAGDANVPKPTSRWGSNSNGGSNMKAIVREETKSRKEEYVTKGAAKDEDTRKNKPWIRPGIVVKVLNKHVGEGKFYKKKGTIKKVEDSNKYVAQVKVKVDDRKVVLKVDQADLETVIPPLDEKVLVVRGKHAGKQGRLQRVHEDKYNADVELDEEEKVLHGIEYEDFSKLDPKYTE